MFENALANIRQKFKSSSLAAGPRHSIRSDKSSLRDNLQFLKLKFTKAECNLSTESAEEVEVSCLSPRAVGTAECARTEVEWPAEPEHHRNVLDKFTDIINEKSSPRTTRKRNDREEIRRRLAMGAESEDVTTHDRPGRKPSLHSRLQSGMNLQICFMNEAVSDNESQVSDTERNPGGSISSNYILNHPYKNRPLSATVLRNENVTAKMRPSSLALKPTKSRSSHSLGHIPLKESDFHALQATLQTEARIALAQAKELARVHMERERRSRATSPVTEMLRRSLLKASAPLPPDRRRVSRQLLTDMNIAQLQVIVNSLCGEVEQLSEALVRLLMERDELHMSQDSMLVDIEDLTRYLGVKEQGTKKGGAAPVGRGGVRRLTSLVQKK